ncbi:ABC transporter permease [Streptomycetaceae bacterium NBC_01309]
MSEIAKSDPMQSTEAVSAADIEIGGMGQRVGSLWSDAWYDLRRRKLFIGSAFIIVVLLAFSAFPQLFTDHNPRDAGACQLQNSLKDPSSSHWFGYDVQGCDVYTKVIWSTRNSIVVGFSTVILVTVVGGALGLIAGYTGGWIDGLLSRFADIFFAIPLMLGAILALAVFDTGDAFTVALIMAALAWPKIFRLMRGAVIANKYNDYVVAARALGGGTFRVTVRHIMPNAIAPVLVYVTISLGEFIAAEAALSYLGVGIQPPGISWGLMISDAQERFLLASHPLLFPSLFLSVTVLSFILMGDAVRDALDPKNR